MEVKHYKEHNMATIITNGISLIKSVVRTTGNVIELGNNGMHSIEAVTAATKDFWGKTPEEVYNNSYTKTTKALEYSARKAKAAKNILLEGLLEDNRSSNDKEKKETK